MTTTNDPSPQPHATAEQVEAARHDSKLAQVLYHDWEAESYDDKWSISYDKRCVDYARDLFDATVPGEEHRRLPYDRALELGCGSGFFLLNLIQAGVARRGSVTDLSPGMVKVAVRNGENLGLEIDGRVADAEGIPYDDDTFDLVVGHAVLHHIPDVELSLREAVRVLKPGGRFVFAGEPTTVGNGYARALSTATWRAVTNATRLPGLTGWRRPQAELDESSRAAALEAIVDLHTFEPDDLEGMARNAGAVDVSSATTEFTAAMLGWPLRTFEAAAPPGRLGWGWAKFAFSSWITLSWVDNNLWRRVIPKGWYYNVMVTGVKARFRRARSPRAVFTVDDVAYLRSSAGADALAAVAGYPLTDTTRIADVAAVRASFGERTGVLVETVLLRRRATAKLGDAAGWLFTGDALQQATATPVAAHRARRLAGMTVHDVTCSIGTELATLRSTADVLGSDIDPVRLAMARYNVTGVHLVRADALRPVSRGVVVLADPGRRGAGGRVFKPRDFSPPLDVLLDTYRDRELVVKMLSRNRFRSTQRAPAKSRSPHWPVTCGRHACGRPDWRSRGYRGAPPCSAQTDAPSR